MNQTRDIALIDELRVLPVESFWLESKRGNTDKMKNASLCVRLGIDPKNTSQASGVMNKTLAAGLIRVADLDHPRAGYVPHWA
jgi:hypothetical protein